MAGFPPPQSGGFGQPPSGGFGQPPSGFGQPPSGYGQPPSGFGQPPGGYGMPAGPAPGPVPNFILWMIIGFGQIILCGNLLFGIPAGVLALLAKNEWDQGKYDSSLGKLKISKILGIIGLVLMGVGILVYIGVMVFAVAAGAAAPTSGYGY